MLNAYQFSGSADDLLKLMTQHAVQQRIDAQIVEMLQQFFEKELSQENRSFSRPERTRLFQQVAKAILTDALGKIDGAQ